MRRDAGTASKRRKILSVTKKDLKIETFRSGKSGGQKRDKTSSAVRITHPPSGASGTSQDSRKRTENQKLAFRRMVEDPKFKLWLRVQSGRAEADVTEKVEQWMRPENLKIETKKDGQWVE